MEGFERLLGAHRSLKEALFSTLISADFLQNLPKFCSKDTRREPKDLWIPLRKSSENPPFPPLAHLTAAQHPKNISENFQYFLGCLYKRRKQAPPRAQKPTRKRTADPVVDFAVGPTADSAVHLWWILRHILNESCSAPFSRIFQRGSLLPPRPPTSPKPKKCAAQSNYPSRCT